MPLGREVGLGPGGIVLDGDPAPPKKLHSSPSTHFSAHVYCGETAGWIKMPLGMDVSLSQGHIVLDEYSAPLSPKRGTAPPLFGPCLLWPNGWWIKMPLGMDVGLSQGHIVLDEYSAPLSPKRGTAPPLFGPCLLWPNGWMDQDATWYRGRPRPRGHCVRWGPSSPKTAHQPPPIFRLCLLWIKMPLGTETGLSPGDSV